MFNSVGLTAKGLGQLSLGRTAGATESFKRAKALTAIQAQKLESLQTHTLHTTHT